MASAPFILTVRVPNSSHWSSGSAAVTIWGPRRRPSGLASTRTLSHSQWYEGPSPVYLATTVPYSPWLRTRVVFPSGSVESSSADGSCVQVPRKLSGIGSADSVNLLRTAVSPPSSLVQVSVPSPLARMVCRPPSSSRPRGCW